MADTFETVKEIIVDLLGVDPAKVTPEARFREDLRGIVGHNGAGPSDMRDTTPEIAG